MLYSQEDKLRLALLEYLKRYHPNDHETYTMVTLNFTMHREIANMLQDAAYQQLKVLEKKQIGIYFYYWLLIIKKNKELILVIFRKYTRDYNILTKYITVL